MKGFVWVPPVHPIGAGPGLAQKLVAPLAGLYGKLLPEKLKKVVRSSDIVVIESCAAIALYEDLRKEAPDASFIYSMSDRLDVVGMHPALQASLERNAGGFDLIRVPAQALLADFGDAANAAYVPHGLQKEAFDAPAESPYPTGPNAVLIGDMMLDQPLLEQLVERFAHVNFHYFGRTPLKFGRHPNLTSWGEQPFDRLVPFIKFADVGLALYEQHPGLEYLAESSLKNIQYAYCGLPVVGPDFIRNVRVNLFGYDPSGREGAAAAMSAALAAGRSSVTPQIPSWTDVAGEMLAKLPVRGASQKMKSALPNA